MTGDDVADSIQALEAVRDATGPDPWMWVALAVVILALAALIWTTHPRDYE